MFTNARGFRIRDSHLTDASQANTFESQSHSSFDQSQTTTNRDHSHPIYDQSQAHFFHPHSHAQFNQSHQYSFHDSSRPLFNQSQHFYGPTQPQGRSGREILSQAIANDAMLNHHNKCDAPRCHPETRKAVLGDIYAWVEDEHKVSRIVWLHGPAGSGKTAIQRTIAEHCEGLGQLGATFFFWRSASTRNHAKHLFSTIAYQLLQNVPQVQAKIEEVVLADPSITNKSLEIQLERLIIQPLLSVHHLLTKDFIILIDGLDECTQEADQLLVLDLICSVAFRYQFPLCFIVASRTESYISDKFNSGILHGLTRQISLMNYSDIDDDIELYLTSGFARIHEDYNHRYTMSFVRKPWPKKGVIGELVDRSSGQFIYQLLCSSLLVIQIRWFISWP